MDSGGCYEKDFPENAYTKAPKILFSDGLNSKSHTDNSSSAQLPITLPLFSQKEEKRV
jgi:hypothetical protein